MNSTRLRLTVPESTPTIHTGSLRGKRDTTRKDGGARNVLEVEITDGQRFVWLRAEPEHGGGWYCHKLRAEPEHGGGWYCHNMHRTGWGNRLSSAINDCIQGTGFLGAGPYTVTLTDIDGECHEGKGKRLAGAVDDAYAAHVYAQKAGKARGGA